MAGKVWGSLYDVESSNIWPFTPSVEEWSDPVSGELATTAVMRVLDLELAFKDMACSEKPHVPKNKHVCIIAPIKINGRNPFVLSSDSNTYDDTICPLCDPPLSLLAPR